MTHTTITSTGAKEAEALAWPLTVASLYLCGFCILYFGGEMVRGVL